MAKGMSLDEFKIAISSDASIENVRLKKEIDLLKFSTSKKIKELTEERDQYKDWCKALGNRCFVYTGGGMCLNCGVDACPHMPNENDIMEAVNYMIKNNMPRTEETRERVNNFIKRKKENK